VSATIAEEPDILKSAAITEGPSSSDPIVKELEWLRCSGADLVRREGEVACTGASAYATHALESHLVGCFSYLYD
jgi:hypothetical protein